MKVMEKMAEYIDRAAVISVLSSRDAPWDAVARVKNIPAADVVERKHGKWIGIPHKTVSKRNRTIHSMMYICPLCRHSNGRHKSNFCPNCGARMEGDGE